MRFCYLSVYFRPFPFQYISILLTLSILSSPFPPWVHFPCVFFDKFKFGLVSISPKSLWICYFQSFYRLISSFDFPLNLQRTYFYSSILNACLALFLSSVLFNIYNLSIIFFPFSLFLFQFFTYSLTWFLFYLFQPIFDPYFFIILSKIIAVAISFIFPLYFFSLCFIFLVCLWPLENKVRN